MTNDLKKYTRERFWWFFKYRLVVIARVLRRLIKLCVMVGLVLIVCLSLKNGTGFIRSFFFKNILTNKENQLLVTPQKYYFPETIYAKLKKLDIKSDTESKEIYDFLRGSFIGLKNISVKFKINGDITVDYTEREPIFLITQPKFSLQALDAEGVVFEAVDKFKEAKAPIVRYLDESMNKTELLKWYNLIGQNAFISSNIVSLDNFYDIFWGVNLKNGVKIYIKTDTVSEKMLIFFKQAYETIERVCGVDGFDLGTVENTQNLKDCGLVEIDFRVADKVLINFNKKVK